MRFITGMFVGALVLAASETSIVYNAREFYLHKTPDEKMLQIDQNTYEINPQDQTFARLARSMAQMRRHKP